MLSLSVSIDWIQCRGLLLQIVSDPIASKFMLVALIAGDSGLNCMALAFDLPPTAVNLERNPENWEQISLLLDNSGQNLAGYRFSAQVGSIQYFYVNSPLNPHSISVQSPYLDGERQEISRRLFEA